MKSICLLNFLLLLFTTNSAQTNSKSVFDYTSKMPEFPGGDIALMQFIQSNIKYPQHELDSGIAGKVIVKFVVTEDGGVEDVIVIKGVSPGLNAEAIRVINLLPKFQPAMLEGKPVSVNYNLPVTFRLSDPKLQRATSVEDKIDRDVYFREAIEYLKDKKYAEAIKYLDESIKQFPRDHICYELKAECLFKIGKNKQACKEALRAKEKGSPTADELLTSFCE